MNWKELEHRYRNDPTFNRVVTVILNILEDVHLTPHEMREAAMMACYEFELKHPRPIIISGHPWEPLNKSRKESAE